MSHGWAGKLLVAQPDLRDPNFHRTVVLLLQHDPDEGALGIVLNRPSEVRVESTVPEWTDLAADPPVVHLGGPCQPEAAICLGRTVLGTEAASAYAPLTLPDGPDPQLGTVDLEAPPVSGLRHVRVFAGYAGWGPGQLEGEIEEQSWWVVDGLPGDAFVRDPCGLWAAVLRRQGLPLALIATATDTPQLN